MQQQSMMAWWVIVRGGDKVRNCLIGKVAEPCAWSVFSTWGGFLWTTTRRTKPVPVCVLRNVGGDHPLHLEDVVESGALNVRGDTEVAGRVQCALFVARLVLARTDRLGQARAAVALWHHLWVDALAGIGPGRGHELIGATALW